MDTCAKASDLHPRTAVTVKLNDGTFSFLAGHLWVFPALKKLLRDGKGGDGVVLDIDCREFLSAFCHMTAGGKPGISFPRAYPKLGIHIKPEWMQSLSSFDDALVMKEIDFGGSLVALIARGKMDEVAEQHRSACDATYGNTFVRTSGDASTGAPTGRGQSYSRTTRSLLSNRSDDVFSFEIPRTGDLCDTLVLKVLLPALPQGRRWKEDAAASVLVDACLTVGGVEEQRLSGSINHVLAVTQGLWPAHTNACRGEALRTRRSARDWLLTIPLMFSENPETRRSFPTVACTLSAMHLTVTLLHPRELVDGEMPHDFQSPLKVLLDVDETLMDQDTRNRLFLLGEDVGKDVDEDGPSHDAETTEAAMDRFAFLWDAVPVKRQPPTYSPINGTPRTNDASTPKSDAKPSLGRHVLPPSTQVVRRMQRTGFDSIARTVTLPFKNLATGLLVTLRYKHASTAVDMMPLRSMTVALAGKPAWKYDAKDLLEWNWLKCGVKPSLDAPISLLVPFGTDMFRHEFPCAVNLDRIDVVSLESDVRDDCDADDWAMEVHCLSYNYRTVADGACSMRFIG